MKSLQLYIILILSFNSALFSADLSCLGKRVSLNTQEIKAKKSKTIYKDAVENLENLARGNIPFEGELEEYLRNRTGVADEKGNTLLHYAVLYHNTNLLLELLATDRININSYNEQGDTPLELAARTNNPPAIDALLQHEPEFLSAFNALKIAYIIGNPSIITTLENFLNNHPQDISWNALSYSYQMGKTKKIHFERFEAFNLFKQSQELKQIILNTPNFLNNLRDPFGRNILNEDWRHCFEPNFVILIEDIVSQPKNFNWFIRIFSKEEQEKYFYIIIELFFGKNVADWAFEAIGDKDFAVLQDITTFIHSENHNIVEYDEVIDELLPYLEKIPQVSAKIIINSFKYKRLKSLKKVLNNIPSWFINMEEIKTSDLFIYALTQSLIYNKIDFMHLFMSYNYYNINQKFYRNRDTIIEILIYRKDVNLDIFKLILSYNPNINYQDSRNSSYLMMLTSYPEKESYLKEILSHNPDLSLKNSIGQTALFQAIMNNNLTATSLILEKIKNDPHSYFYNYIEGYTKAIEKVFFNNINTNYPPIELIKLQMKLDELKKICKSAQKPNLKPWENVWN